MINMIPNDWLFPYVHLDVPAYLSAAKSPRASDLPEFAEWISDAAQETDLNPRWLLMVAEKEQSFITRKADGSAGWKRALNYTLGYGATDSHDIPKYKGTKNQVFSAARGLRGYLTKGSSLYVGDMVGKPFICLDGNYTPTTLAGAAAVQFTPWIKYLPDNLSVWSALRSKAPSIWDERTSGGLGYADGPITIKVADTPYPGELRGGVAYQGAMPVRMYEKVGGQVFDHIADERAVYVYAAKKKL
jgi:hypothetical protein